MTPDGFVPFDNSKLGLGDVAPAQPSIPPEVLKAAQLGKPFHATVAPGQTTPTFNDVGLESVKPVAAQPAAPAPTPKPAAPQWEQISTSPRYQSMKSEEQERVRTQYFIDFVAPNVPTPQLDAAKASFDKDTKPTMLDRVGSAISSSVGKIADVMKPVPVADPADMKVVSGMYDKLSDQRRAEVAASIDAGRATPSQKAFLALHAQRTAIPDRTWAELGTDTARQFTKGVVNLVESASFLSEKLGPLAINSAMEKRLTGTTEGERVREFARGLNDAITNQSSDKLKAQLKEYEGKDGFIDTLGFLITNPTYVSAVVTESAPGTLVGGGVAGRAASFTSALEAKLGQKLATEAAKKSAAWAGASTEAVQTLGQVGSQLEQRLDEAGITDPMARAKAYTAAVPAMLATLLFGRIGGSVEGKLFSKALRDEGASGVAKTVVKDAFKEGVIEELPQSVSEQLFQNVGERAGGMNTDLMAGVGKAGATGLAAGAATGAGIGLVTSGGKKEGGKPVEDAAPLPADDVLSDIDSKAHEAATSPNNDLPEPTPAQKEAGNYKKGHVNIDGLDISIENPGGSERKGTDPDGNEWSVEMPAHYGYIRGTVGKDKDHFDVYIGNQSDSETVFVVDQVDLATGKFDEHKGIIKAGSRDEAIALYNAGFSDGKGPERMGAITEMPMAAFKAWVANTKNTTRPLAFKEKAPLLLEDKRALIVARGGQVFKSQAEFDEVWQNASVAERARMLDLAEKEAPNARPAEVPATPTTEPAAKAGPTAPGRIPEPASPAQGEAVAATESPAEVRPPFDDYTYKGETKTFKTERAAINYKAAGKGKIPPSYKPRQTPDGWVLSKPVKERSAAQKANDAKLKASRRNVLPDRDNLWTAIAKLGGLSRDEVVSTWGTDPADFKKLQPLVGKPVLRAKGGLSIDGMLEQLAQYGYLTLDQDGKADVAELEELFAAGGDHYTPQGIESRLSQQQQAADEEFTAAELEVAGVAELSDADESALGEYLDELDDALSFDGPGITIDPSMSDEQVDAILDEIYGKQASDQAGRAAPQEGPGQTESGRTESRTQPDSRKAEKTGRVAPPPGQPDPRIASATRKRIGELSLEEARKELRTSSVTGLENRRAFDDDEADNPAPLKGYADGDNFKAVNTLLGHEEADKVLRVMGEIFAQAAAKTGAKAYHRSGDEFLFRFKSQEESRAFQAAVKDIGAGTVISLQDKKGNDYEYTNPGFSLGIADTLEAAERRADDVKTERTASGERSAVAGQAPRGLSAVLAKGRQGDQGGGGRQDPDVLVAEPPATPSQEGVSASETIQIGVVGVTPKGGTAITLRKDGDAFTLYEGETPALDYDSAEPVQFATAEEAVAELRKNPRRFFSSKRRFFTAEEYRAKQGEPEYQLEAESESDIKAREEKEKASQAAEAKAQRDADDKAKADSERDSFTLTGSDRAADVAEARGQRSIFDEPIKDLGEKIGGARKDMAIKTGPSPAAAKTSDDARPAWQRRFTVSEVVAGAQKGRWVVNDTKSTDFAGRPKPVGGWSNTYATEADAKAAIPLAAVSLKHRVIEVLLKGEPQRFEIWRDVSDRKRVKVIEQTFDTREAALTYMAKNAGDIIEANTTFGESSLPIPDSKKRIGKVRRTGDVAGQDFMDTFGFRGVEFGNWNNQEERQQVMNEAYDGLLDLAEVMGVPAKAIGLNGDLALAFGARGHGLHSARAHYERKHAVINLTKMHGAGALAHEWFHAVDHYFGRLDGKAGSTWKVNPDGTRVFPTGAVSDDYASHGFGYKSAVRQPVRDAYREVMNTIFTKATEYVEDVQQADKFVAKTRDGLAQKLDALRGELSKQKDPEYYKRHNKPASAELLAEFDGIAQRLVDGEGLESSFRMVDGVKAITGGRWTNDALERLSAIHKEVRGRSGFRPDNSGALDQLRSQMKLHADRLKMLADAQQATPKTKRVPTDFAMGAKSLDQGRGEDYWTTPHEMAARAFQAFVHDRIAETGGSSPFLNFAPEGFGIPTPWGAVRPFPAGQERKAISAALQRFVDALEVRESDTGLSLFDSATEREQYRVESKDKRDAYTQDLFPPKVPKAKPRSDPGQRPAATKDGNVHTAGAVQYDDRDSAEAMHDHAKVEEIGEQIELVEEELRRSLGQPTITYFSLTNDGNIAVIKAPGNSLEAVAAAADKLATRYGLGVIIRSSAAKMEDGAVAKLGDLGFKPYGPSVSENRTGRQSYNPVVFEKNRRGRQLYSIRTPDSDAVRDGSIERTELRAMVKAVADAVNVNITVVEDAAELQDRIGEPVNLDAAGVAYRDDIYLVRENIAGRAQAEQTIWHELFHVGIQRDIPEFAAYDRALRELAIKNDALRAEARAWRKRNGDKWIADMEARGMTREDAEADLILISLEEALAERSGKEGEFIALRGIRQVIAALQKLLRAIGLTETANRLESATGAEALELIVSAREATQKRFAEPGRGLVPAMSVVPRESRAVAKPTSSRGIIDPILRNLGGQLLADKITKPAYDWLLRTGGKLVPEVIKAGIVDKYGLAPAYITRRQDMMVHQAAGALEARTTIEKLVGLDREQSRIAYLWMTQREAKGDALLEALPATERGLLKSVKADITAMGDEAVRLGQLSKESMERNRMSYLHRTYEKHETDDPMSKAQRSRTIRVLGDQYKGRGMVDWVSRDSIEKPTLSTGQKDTGERGGAKLDVPPGVAIGDRFVRYEKRGNGSTQVRWVPAGQPPVSMDGWQERDVWEARFEKGGKIGMWRDFSAEERERMGEIDEVKYALAKTLNLMTHDIEVGRFFEWIAAEYGKTEAPGEVVNATDSLARAYRPDEWVKVPETTVPGTDAAVYGKLAGKYVPGPIWNDIRQLNAARQQPLGNTFDAVLRGWKISKTALSPATHMNNVMANFVMADMHDVGARDVAKAVKVLAIDNEQNADILRRFEASGAQLGSFASREIKRETLKGLLEQLQKETDAADISGRIRLADTVAAFMHRDYARAVAGLADTRMIRGAGFAVKKAMDLYQAEDTLFRMAAFLKATDEGMPDLEAGRQAREAFLDYNITAPWINAARTTFLPFIAFTYRAVPMLTRIAAEKPWKLFKYMAVAGGLNAAAYALLGLGGDDERRERALLPDEKNGKLWGVVPKLIRLPWNDDRGNPKFIDVRRWIPMGDIVDFGSNHAAVPVPPMLMPGGPLWMLAEVIANKSSFTGKQISLETDSFAERALKSLDYVYKGYMPNLLGVPNVYATTAVLNAGKGKTDAFGREQSVIDAVLSSVGLKIASYPGDVLLLNAKLAFDMRDRELVSQARKLTREAARNGITRDELDRGLAQIREKRLAEAEKLRVKVDAAK